MMTHKSYVSRGAYMRTKIASLLFSLVMVFATTGCGPDSASFSILPDGSTFFQGTQSAPIDILWVIDNSGSMRSSQDNLARNFPSFIQGFAENNYDFQMGVTATDAYVALPSMTPIYNSLPSGHYLKQAPQANWSRFRDGAATHTGVYILNKLTPSLQSTFVTNATLGTNGLGDERMFQSMRTALDSDLNTGFLRSNGFLAVIILTDEDDFSHDGTNYLDGQYSSPALHSVDSYRQYLDTLTSSTGTRRNYNVHAISIQDTACRDYLNGTGSGRRVATRVNELATVTGGIKGSLCDSEFSNSLQQIAQNIIQLSTQFYLSRLPIESTIKVLINGALVPQAFSPSDNGWTYNATANSIMFQGTAVPPQGAQIQVNFDPQSLGS